jgi:flagellin-specific chaperone FliS
MKNYFIIIGCILFFLGCNQKNKDTKKATNTNNFTNQFILKGELLNGEASTVYLNKIIGNSIYQIDSAKIENNKFTIQGIVEYPERFAITFDSYASKTILILENLPINITIDVENINDPIITGSPLNAKLDEYKTISKSIFRKIDYLFPRFQKARLENDVKKLEEIGTEMKAIEKEFQEFSFQFIKKNNNSYIAPMLLTDQLKTSTIDTVKIKQSYQLLSEEIKHSPDAQIIATFLELH